jgi:hypothetical protein
VPRGSKARSCGGVQKSPVTAARGVGSVRCANLSVGEPRDVSRSRGAAQGVSTKGCTNLSTLAREHESRRNVSLSTNRHAKRDSLPRR